MTTLNSPTLLLSPDQAAGFLNISKRTLFRLVAQQELGRPLKIGRASRFHLEDLEDYVQGLRQASQPELTTR